MKKIALSFVSIAAVVGLAIGATSAYFTSAKSTEMNTFAAGTLNVDAAVGGSWNSQTVNIGHLAPGEITNAATFTIKNTGDIDAATFSKFKLANDSGLAGALKIYDFKVDYYKADGTAANRWTGSAAPYDGYYSDAKNRDWFIKDGDAFNGKMPSVSTKLNSWAAGDGNLDGAGAWDMEGLPAGASYVVTVRFQMDPEATNWYMGKSVEVGYEVKATQLKEEALAAFGYPGHFTYLNTNANTYR